MTAMIEVDGGANLQEAAWSSEVPMYGGAIKCDLPASFEDVSNFRPVPDHQEVWADRGSDRSLIIEILERKKEIRDEEAMAFFLADLAACNDAHNPTLLSSKSISHEQALPHLLAEAHCFVGLGEQTVSKFKEAHGNRIHVHACLIRLVRQETDMLVTLNDPVEIARESSSGGIAVVHGEGEELFSRVLRSFKIVDWGIFGVE